MDNFIPNEEILVTEGCPLMQRHDPLCTISSLPPIDNLTPTLLSPTPSDRGNKRQRIRRSPVCNNYHTQPKQQFDQWPPTATVMNNPRAQLRQFRPCGQRDTSSSGSSDYKLLDISNDSKAATYGLSQPLPATSPKPINRIETGPDNHDYESLKKPEVYNPDPQLSDDIRFGSDSMRDRDLAHTLHYVVGTGRVMNHGQREPFDGDDGKEGGSLMNRDAVLLIQTSAGTLCFPRDTMYQHGHVICSEADDSNHYMRHCCTGQTTKDSSMIAEQNLINKYFPASTLNKFGQGHYSLEEDEKVSPYAYSDPMEIMYQTQQNRNALQRSGTIPIPNDNKDHDLSSAHENCHQTKQAGLYYHRNLNHHQGLHQLSSAVHDLSLHPLTAAAMAQSVVSAASNNKVNGGKKYRSTTDQMLYSAKSRLKNEISNKCDWKKLAMILILCSLLSLILISYLLAVSLGRLNWNLKSGSDTYNKAGPASSLARHQSTSLMSHGTFPLLRRSSDQSGDGESRVPTYVAGQSVEMALRSRNMEYLKLDLTPASRHDFSVPGHYVTFNISFESLDSVIGIYFRKNDLPSHVQYDHMEIINGQNKLVDPYSRYEPYDFSGPNMHKRLSPRSTLYFEHDSFKAKEEDGQGNGGKSLKKREFPISSYTATFGRYLEYQPGIFWVMSLYNDDPDNDITVGLNAIIKDDDQSPDFYPSQKNYQAPGLEPTNLGACPQNCHYHGRCDRGICKCFPGYSGWDCEKSVCPAICYGNGIIHKGKCHCHKGWKGDECNIRTDQCIVSNCNGRGYCQDGRCHCRTGYIGSSCEEVDCQPSNCSGNGICLSINPSPTTRSGSVGFSRNRCFCNPGFGGEGCQINLIQTYATSGGACNTNSAPGSNLEKNQFLNLALAAASNTTVINCGGNGYISKSYASDTSATNPTTCTCYPGWIGPLCQKRECDPKCLLNEGTCTDGGECTCPNGRSGPDCSLLTCHASCHNHGECQNGICYCHTGWNGKYCSINGCPNNCHKNGACLYDSNAWSCNCKYGWAGKNCSVMLETSCTDNMDNDLDGLIDCQDSECCSHQACRNDIQCKSAPDPQEVLLTKQPPNVMASFFARVKFLLEENSVQMQASFRSFNESKVSVVRGKVLDIYGQPIIGARISVVSETAFGYTFSRLSGEFDFMVNGGGLVRLTARREPFKTVEFTLFVTANEFYVALDAVVLRLDDKFGISGKKGDESIVATSSICNNFLTVPPPLIFANPSPFTTLLTPTDMTEQQMGVIEGKGPSFMDVSPSTQINLADQSLRETFTLPQTNAKMVYVSRKTADYKSAINIQLLGDNVPQDLIWIHIRIDIQGLRYEKVLEAEPNLIYTQFWEKRNSYRQTVYGLTQATIHVGYQYTNCRKIIWTKFNSKIMGQELPISDIGDWNLDIHNRFDYRQGILYKGNGQTIFLKEKTKHGDNNDTKYHKSLLQPIYTLLGDGKRGTPLIISNKRDGLSWSGRDQLDSDNTNEANRLVDPQSLTVSPIMTCVQDFTIMTAYLGDYNVIYKLSIKLPSYATNSDSTAFELTQKIYQAFSQPGRDGGIGSNYLDQGVPNSGDFGHSTGQAGYAAPLKITERRPVLALDTSLDPSNKFEMAVHPLTGQLFVSMASTYRIVRLKSELAGEMRSSSDLTKNWEPFAGNGQPCSTTGHSRPCQNGILATKSRLSQPRSMTFDKDGKLYFIDGNTIRYVDQDAYIYDLMRTTQNKGVTGLSRKSMNCTETRTFHEMEFIWPLKIVYNTYDDLLYLLDDNSAVYRLDPKSRTVSTLVSSPQNTEETALGAVVCWFDSELSQTITRTPGVIKGLTYSPLDGSIILTLSTGHKGTMTAEGASSIVRLNPTQLAGPISVLMSNHGSKFLKNLSKSGDNLGIDNDNISSSPLDNDETGYGNPLSIPSDIGFSPDGTFLILADRGDLRLKYLFMGLDNNLQPSGGFQNWPGDPITTTSDKISGDKRNAEERYTLADIEAGQIYAFNRWGSHIESRDLGTGSTVWTFVYTLNSYLGKLKSVSYRLDNNDDPNGASTTIELDRRSDFGANAVTSLIIRSHDSQVTCHLKGAPPDHGGLGGVECSMQGQKTFSSSASYTYWDGGIKGTESNPPLRDDHYSVRSALPQISFNVAPPPNHHHNHHSTGIAHRLISSVNYSSFQRSQPKASEQIVGLSSITDVRYTPEGRISSWIPASGGLGAMRYRYELKYFDNGFIKVPPSPSFAADTSTQRAGYALPIQVYKNILQEKNTSFNLTQKDGLTYQLLLSEGECYSLSSLTLGGGSEGRTTYYSRSLSQITHIKYHSKNSHSHISNRQYHVVLASPSFYFGDFKKFESSLNIYDERTPKPTISIKYMDLSAQSKADFRSLPTTPVLEKILAPRPLRSFMSAKFPQHRADGDYTFEIFKANGKELLYTVYDHFNKSLRIYDSRQQLLTVIPQMTPVGKNLPAINSLGVSISSKGSPKDKIDELSLPCAYTTLLPKTALLSTFGGYTLHIFEPGVPKNLYVIDYDIYVPEPRIIIRDPIGVRSIFKIFSATNATSYNDGTAVKNSHPERYIMAGRLDTSISQGTSTTNRTTTYRLNNYSNISLAFQINFDTSGNPLQRSLEIVLKVGGVNIFYTTFTFHRDSILGRLVGLEHRDSQKMTRENNNYETIGLAYDNSSGSLTSLGPFTFTYPTTTTTATPGISKLLTQKIVMTDGSFLVSHDDPMAYGSKLENFEKRAEECTIYKLGPTLVYSYEIERINDNSTDPAQRSYLNKLVENYDPKLLPIPSPPAAPGGGSRVRSNGLSGHQLIGVGEDYLRSRNFVFSYTSGPDREKCSKMLQHINQDGAGKYSFHYGENSKDLGSSVLTKLRVESRERTVGKKIPGYEQRDGTRRVTHRRGHSFIYDGRGRLIEMAQRIENGETSPNRIDSRFFGYDDSDRLVYIYDRGGDWIDLFMYLFDELVTIVPTEGQSYPNMASTGPSHYYRVDTATGKIISHMVFTHSPTPVRKLLAIYTDDQNYYVITDAWNSPIAILRYGTDSNGGGYANSKTFPFKDPSATSSASSREEASCVKFLEYDPLGDIIRDSNTAFHLPLGFKGGIRDVQTDLIFYGASIYDPYIGDFLNPSPLITSTDTLRPFCFHCTSLLPPPVQQLLTPKINYGMDLTNLIYASGINVNNLILHKNVINLNVPFLEFLPSYAVDISGLPHQNYNFLGNIHKSLESSFLLHSFRPTTLSVNDGLQIQGTILGQGISVSLDSNGWLKAQLLPNHDNFAANTSILVNEAILVQLPTIRNAAGKMMIFLIKESQEKSNKDLWELGIKSKVRYLDVYTKLSVIQINKGTGSSGSSNLNICLEGQYQIISVTYGTTVEAEKKRISKIFSDAAE